GDQGDDPRVGDEEEIQDVEVTPRPQVENDQVGVQPLDGPHEAKLLLVQGIGRRDGVERAGDQAEILEARIDGDFLQALHPPQDEVRKRLLGMRDTEAGMQVCAPQVEVDQHHSPTPARELDAQAGGDERLADPPLASADRDDALKERGRGAHVARRDGLGWRVFGEGAHRTYTSTGPSDCHPGKAAFPTAESWTASVLRDAVRRADRDEKRLPELVRRRLSVPQDRIPARPEWPAQQPHPRLLRGSAALLEIAGDAGADDVLPRRLSALRTRNHVVEVELR